MVETPQTIAVPSPLSLPSQSGRPIDNLKIIHKEAEILFGLPENFQILEAGFLEPAANTIPFEQAQVTTLGPMSIGVASPAPQIFQGPPVSQGAISIFSGTSSTVPTVSMAPETILGPNLLMSIAQSTSIISVSTPTISEGVPPISIGSSNIISTAVQASSTITRPTSVIIQLKPKTTRTTVAKGPTTTRGPEAIQSEASLNVSRIFSGAHGKTIGSGSTLEITGKPSISISCPISSMKSSTGTFVSISSPTTSILGPISSLGPGFQISGGISTPSPSQMGIPTPSLSQLGSPPSKVSRVGISTPTIQSGVPSTISPRPDFASFAYHGDSQESPPDVQMSPSTEVLREVGLVRVSPGGSNLGAVLGSPADASQSSISASAPSTSDSSQIFGSSN